MTMPPIVSVIPPPASMTFPSSVPTSSESLQQGNNKVIDDITSHEDDACIVELKKSCVELPVDLSTPSILDNHVTIMKPPMLNHFDMTSNLGDDSASNDLLHDYLVKPVVACPSKNINVYSPLLGWFNDEHCKFLNVNKSFTYICKLSWNTFMSFTYCDDHISLYFTTSEGYSYIHVLHVQKLREIRMDDVYIYNMYTLSLLLAIFQIKQRRGRLCFQKGEDDEDMATLDMIKNIAYAHLFEVISDTSYAITNLCYPEQKYFTYFYFMPQCRMVEHLYEPRMMTREEKMVGCYSRGPLMSKEIIRCCSRSSITSLLAQ